MAQPRSLGLTVLMSTFPLPLPSDGVIREQPAADIGGVTLRYRCADEVAAFARPVIERYRQYHCAGEPLEGLRTMVGFTMWRLQQSGPAEYWITAADYHSDDLAEVTTDDLTFALWIEAAQADAIDRAGTSGDSVDLTAQMMTTKAALTVLEKGRPDELVLERRPPSTDDDSGWLVRTAERSVLRNKQVEVMVGIVAGVAPYVLPYLRLPEGSVVRVAGTRHVGLEVPGVDHALQSLQTTIGGVTLTAKCIAPLAPVLQGVLDEFAAAGEVVVGSRVESGYVPYVVAAGEGDNLRVVCADFSSPQDYHLSTTDDLSVPLATQLVQAFAVKNAGVGGRQTRADASIAVQAAALEDIVAQRPVALTMERMDHEPHHAIPDVVRRSGWYISKPVAGLNDDQRSIRHIDAGELQTMASGFAKYYCLPTGTLLQFAAGELVSAHLIDHARLDEAVQRDPSQTMGALLAHKEVATKLPIT